MTCVAGRVETLASQIATWKVDHAVVTVAMIVGAILRFSTIESRSVWGDEISSLAMATGHAWFPVAEEQNIHSAAYYRESVSLPSNYFSENLVTLLKTDTQGPLYYFLLNLWLHIFGTSDLALRSLSAFVSVCSIPVIYALGYQLSSAKVGAYGALIFSLASFQIAFAQYSRPYALLGFFALLSTLSAIRFAEQKSWNWLLVYAFSAILGLYTHYLFIWNLAFHWIVIICLRPHDRSFFIRRWGLAQILIIGGFLPWLPYFAEQVRWNREVQSLTWHYWHSGSVSVLDAIVYVGRNLALFLTVGRIRGFCGWADGSENCVLDSILTAVFYAVPVVMLGLCSVQFARHLCLRLKEGQISFDPWYTCLLWGLCIFGGPLLADMFLDSRSISIHRYFISASGPVYLAIALAVSSIPSTYLRNAVVWSFLVFLLVATGLYVQGFSGTLSTEQGFRNVAHHLDQSVTDNDLIIALKPGPHPMDLSFYLKSNSDFGMLNIPEVARGSIDIPGQLQDVTRGRKRIWYLDDRGPEIHARQVTLGWLRAHYREIAFKKFTGLDLFLFSS